MKEFRVGKAMEFRGGGTDGPPEADIRILTYGVVDSYKTSWNPGVFQRSIEGGIMPSVFGHDPSRPIGIVRDFRDDGKTLDATLEFLPFEDVPDARIAYHSMKRGAYPGISFAFERNADEEDTENRGATRITDATMVEVSPVLRASVPGSRPLAVRADGQIEISAAADLLAKFAAGNIDLAEALASLKGARSDVTGETFPDYEVDADSVTLRLDSFTGERRAYADTKNHRYLIDTLDHCKAARSYLAKDTRYSDDERLAIRARIDTALTLLEVK